MKGSGLLVWLRHVDRVIILDVLCSERLYEDWAMKVSDIRPGSDQILIDGVWCVLAVMLSSYCYCQPGITLFEENLDYAPAPQ